MYGVLGRDIPHIPGAWDGRYRGILSVWGIVQDIPHIPGAEGTEIYLVYGCDVCMYLYVLYHYVVRMF